MNTKTFFRWLEIHNVGTSVHDEERAEEIVNRLTGLIGGDRLHYLWENGDSPLYKEKYRMNTAKEDYKEAAESLFTGGNYFLVIDSVCFSNAQEPVTLELSGEALISVLNDFYLYLDEIYIADDSFKWFIAFNHRNEMLFFGDSSDERSYAAEKEFKTFIELKNESENE